MTAHEQRVGVSTDYVQVTHAATSSWRNGNTSMETQHVNAVSRQKIPRTCCNALSLHDPAPWMTLEDLRRKMEVVRRKMEDNSLMT